MSIYDIIMKKKRGGELTPEELDYLVCGYTDGSIPDYQMSAFLMAVCFRGMTDSECASLTVSMAKSGDMIDLSSLGENTVDKHSTGGVGDKTTLIIAPLVAAAGGKVAKMSGRGLGHTGGTVDKLESFPGYNTNLAPEDFFSQVEKIGVAVTGQTGNLAPADKKLYALRDVTATVDSIPLIASSIMSKKLAGGSNSIVLDVKVGSGAFMKTEREATLLAEQMKRIGELSGRRVSAIITDMDIPLGNAIGNSLEVKEAITVLRGGGPCDLRAVCLELAAAMLSLSLSLSSADAMKLASKTLGSGAAYKKFIEWIGAQGGNTAYAENVELFEKARVERRVLSSENGYISSMDTEKIGGIAVALGAGRVTKEDAIDHSAGIVLHKKTGDEVKRGEPVATLYTSDEKKADEAEKEFLSLLKFTEVPVEKREIIIGRVGV